MTVRSQGQGTGAPVERGVHHSSRVIKPRWYTIEQVAVMLGYGLTKTKYLVHTGQIRSVKDGGSRRILPEWDDDYIRQRVDLAPKTYEKYEAFTRLHILPYLGTKRLDKLQVKDIRQWLNKLAQVCQCCLQGKDAARQAGKRRCCAIGQCCHAALSARSRADARDTLQAALTCAVEEDVVSRNPAAVIRLPAPRTRKRRWWTVEDARRFLESTRAADEPLYAAFVLILVLGLGS